MRKRYEVYRCEVCGNIVQILHGGVGTLVCCSHNSSSAQINAEILPLSAMGHVRAAGKLMRVHSEDSMIAKEL